MLTRVNHASIKSRCYLRERILRLRILDDRDRSSEFLAQRRERCEVPLIRHDHVTRADGATDLVLTQLHFFHSFVFETGQFPGDQVAFLHLAEKKSLIVEFHR